MTDRLAEIFSDNRRMMAIEKAIHNISEAIEALARKAGALGDASVAGLDKTKDALEGASDGLKNLADELGNVSKETEKVFSNWENSMMRLQGLIGTTAQSFVNLGQTMRNVQTQGGQAAIDTVLQSLPPGLANFVEIGIGAAKRNFEFDAAGRRGTMAFAGNSFQTKDEMMTRGGALGAQMKSLEEMPGGSIASKQEVEAVYAAMAAGGAKVDLAFKELKHNVEGFPQSFAGLSLATDKAFGLAAGASMQFSSELTKNTGGALEDTVGLVRDLGLASHATGLSMEQFVGSILHVTSALRMQGSDAKSLASTLVNMNDAFAKMTGLDVKSTRVGDLGQMALGQLGGWVSSLSDGLKGWLGQEIGMKMTGRQFSKIGGLMGMETGFMFDGAKPGQDFATTTAGATYGRFANKFQDNDELYMALTRAAGMDKLLARFMIETHGEGFTPGKFDEKRKMYEDQMKEAKNMQPLTNSTFETLMKQLQTIVNVFGDLEIRLLSALLHAVLGGFDALLRVTKGDFDALGDFRYTMGLEGDKIFEAGKRLGGAIVGAKDVPGLDTAITDMTGWHRDEKGNGGFLQKAPQTALGSLRNRVEATALEAIPGVGAMIQARKVASSVEHWYDQMFDVKTTVEITPKDPLKKSVPDTTKP